MLMKSAATAGAVAVLATAGPLFHISSVDVCGDAAAVSAAEVRGALAGAGTMTYFAIDLPALEDRITQLHQVRAAQARLAGPRKVELCVEARVPLARTPAGALVDARGELYYGGSLGGKPIYAGPSERTADFADLFRTLRTAGERAGFEINQVAWRSDGWHVLISTGWTLKLGRSALAERVGRFAGAYPQLAGAYADAAGPLTIDLRYMRGMAIAGLNESNKQSEKQT